MQQTKTKQTQSPPRSLSGPAFNMQGYGTPGFTTNTTQRVISPFGNFDNLQQYNQHQDAFVQQFLQNQAQYNSGQRAGQNTQRVPVMESWRQAGDNIASGQYQGNPLATGNMAGLANLFSQYGMTMQPGFQDQLMQLIGQQSAPSLYSPPPINTDMRGGPSGPLPGAGMPSATGFPVGPVSQEPVHWLGGSQYFDEFTGTRLGPSGPLPGAGMPSATGFPVGPVSQEPVHWTGPWLGGSQYFDEFTGTRLGPGSSQPPPPSQQQTQVRPGQKWDAQKGIWVSDPASAEYAQLISDRHKERNEVPWNRLANEPWTPKHGAMGLRVDMWVPGPKPRPENQGKADNLAAARPQSVGQATPKPATGSGTPYKAPPKKAPPKKAPPKKASGAHLVPLLLGRR